MTYLRNGWEHLTGDETAIYEAIRQLARQRRSGNTSQVASYSGLNRTLVSRLATELRMRGFIADVSTNAAHHWRITAQPVPYSAEQRRQDREAARRQRETDEQGRNGTS
jgi:DNA-binding IclR family transcriptional regulator